MILLVPASERRALAYCGVAAAKRLGNSTSASIVTCAATREYPRIVSVYTIRTPSPGGQYDAVAYLLPAFFLAERRVQEQRGTSGVNRMSAAKRKGQNPCPLETSFLRLPPVRVSPHVVTRWVNRRQVARPSAQARPLLPAMALSKALPSVPRVTWPIASSTRVGATDPTPITSDTFSNAARARHVRRFAWTASHPLRTAKRTPHVQ